MNKLMCEWRAELRVQGRSRHAQADRQDNGKPLRSAQLAQDNGVRSVEKAAGYQIVRRGWPAAGRWGRTSAPEQQEGPLFILRGFGERCQQRQLCWSITCSSSPVCSHFHIISGAGLHDCSSKYLHHTINVQEATQGVVRRLNTVRKKDI